MPFPLDITIVIPVKNEEKMLPICLDAIGYNFVKRVVVLDSNSDDSTCEIAINWGAEVIKFEWNGKFPKKRNWFLLTHHIDSKWILFLDADEILTESFKNELKKVLPVTQNNGFILNYTIHFMGKKLIGGYPLNKLALFRVGIGTYEQIAEDSWSSLDMEIHEHPIIKGKIGRLKNRIDHIDNRDIKHYITKHNEYAKWEANRVIQSKKDPKISQIWNFRQRLKYSLMATPFLGPFYFIGTFLMMAGFIDGQLGLKFAILKANYFNKIYKYIQSKE